MAHNDQNRKDYEQRKKAFVQKKVQEHMQSLIEQRKSQSFLTRSVLPLFGIDETYNLVAYVYKSAAMQFEREWREAQQQTPSDSHVPQNQPDSNPQAREDSAPQLWEHEPFVIALIRKEGSGCISRLNEQDSITLTARGTDNQTCLHIAATLHDDLHASELIEFLLRKQPQLINMQDEAGNTAAHLSFMMKKNVNIAICKTFLQCEALDINLQNAAKQTLLDLAITDAPASKLTDVTELAILLINRGANLELANVERKTPLHLAIQHGRTEITELLLNKQAPVNAADKDGNRPIHYATSYAQPAIMELLKKRSADFTATNDAGQNALHYAIMIWNANWQEKKSSKFAFWENREQENSAENTVTTLLKYNKNALSAKDNAGWTPLHYACVTDHIAQNKSYMIILLKNKCNHLLIKQEDNLLTAVTHEGNPAFMIAIVFGMPITIPHKDHPDRKIALAKLLLPETKEQHIQIVNAEGDTALHFAVIIRSPYQSETIDYLLAKGANPFKKNKNNVSPYDLLHSIQKNSHDQTHEERECLKSIKIKFEQHAEYHQKRVAVIVEALPQFTLPAALQKRQNNLPWYALSSEALAQKTPTQANYPPIPTIHVQEADAKRPTCEIYSDDSRYPWRKHPATTSVDSLSTDSTWSEVNHPNINMADSTDSLVHIGSRSNSPTPFELPDNTAPQNR